MLKKSLKITLLLTIITLGFSSCEKDSDTVSSPLHYNWHLTKYSAGLAGLESYNQGEVRWAFNANNTLDVQINVTLSPNSNIPIRTNSTVNYSENGNQITIENTTYSYSFNDSKTELILSCNPALDGPMIKLER